MLNAVITIALMLDALYVGVSAVYLMALVAGYFLLSSRPQGSDSPLNRFVILIPAHNEELLVRNLLQSIKAIEYPVDFFDVVVIADNCTDATSSICKSEGVEVLERSSPGDGGKGRAIAWALESISIDDFDAVCIVDADSTVNQQFLAQLNRHLNKDEKVIQCYNAVGNSGDTWFTQLLHVSRTIGNELYHEAKYRLGLSSYLMGNGMCFKVEVLRELGWTAFSAAEDWEYYTQLVEREIYVAFAVEASARHQESQGLNQATGQRLRWSSGRFRTAKISGIRLFAHGARTARWKTLDAALPLLLPNYSLHLNLALIGLVASGFLPESGMRSALMLVFSSVIVSLAVIFAIGAAKAGSGVKTFKALLFAPVFLLWKGLIDLITLLGIYKGDKWTKSKRS